MIVIMMGLSFLFEKKILARSKLKKIFDVRIDVIPNLLEEYMALF